MKKHNLIFLIAGAVCVSLTAFGFMKAKEVKSLGCDATATAQCQPVSQCAAHADQCKSAEEAPISESDAGQCGSVGSCQKQLATKAETKPVESSATASLTNNIFEASEKIDFEYAISSRFVWSKDKHELRNATSILDLIELPKSHQIQNYWNIQISEFSEEGKQVVTAIGVDEKLTQAQKELLSSLDYTSDFVINGDFKRKYQSGVFSEDTLIYYISVTPTTSATYSKGESELINYLKTQSKSEVNAVQRDQLKPGKIEFLISKEGNVEHVGILSTSGYSSLDEKFVSLINNLPANWLPATNAQGEVVVQKMVFSYGMMGC